ncbi:hypothetical protein ABB37_00584 [Leptomonas pyrrhocoris]|uniref:FYVE-type domain-containing protein n=1 Tax=Leptomonas pyrrhocoris TaxID=157538 RepID=A0A0N0E0F9_LEPPY|nr:hypothetical protein ABB37_00584 [Leptomonas pyrrhocoris]XP_015664845.1 hypothetical protein ABB37_00584 [Leptomonas pyrrhocoris]KPA86405.1 hypothetical protein ABB37_00584 [Leptomonas pyrrhocoris]KPA86406.1 hypothetical protein ABB37_00584 [Leptomonas pyrrhocoris]|eukprot:XP_015664844.1 hypothetical protein ABB37_00584 [Leptomonas pyrrhocoris]
MGEKQSKAYWQDDEEVAECNGCGRAFTATLRRHHCRNCGYVFCGDCSRHRASIPMRGIATPERVCDACYLALRNSNIAGSTLSRGGPGTLPNPSEIPDRERSMVSTPGASGAGAGNGARNGTTAASPSPADPAAKQGTAADASSSAWTEEQQKAEDYYQNLYGADGVADGAGEDDGGAASAANRQEAISPEALERERLIQRWNTVRQATVYVDILVQQSERVEPNTTVEYSRETETLTIQPELPQSEIGVRMLPLPRPCTDSARYLLEPVKTLGMPATALDKALASLAQRLAVQVPAQSIKTVTPAEFTGY